MEGSLARLVLFTLKLKTIVSLKMTDVLIVLSFCFLYKSFSCKEANFEKFRRLGF